jgi:hypothetical protein
MTGGVCPVAKNARKGSGSSKQDEDNQWCLSADVNDDTAMKSRRHTRSAVWSWREESNLQPAVYKTAALPIELRQHSMILRSYLSTRSRLPRQVFRARSTEWA